MRKIISGSLRSPLTWFAYYLMILGLGMAVILTLFLCGVPIPLKRNGVPVESLPGGWIALGYLSCGVSWLCGWGMLRRKKWAVGLYFGIWSVVTLITLLGFGWNNLDLTPVILLCILLCTNEKLT